MTQAFGKIGFIGAGNMGEAIIGALVSSGVYASEDVGIFDVSADRLEFMRQTYGVSAFARVSALFAESDVVVLAVKPQQMNAVLEEITADSGYRIPRRKLVISIAAGIRMAKMEDALYAPLDASERERLPVIRVMPNTPALVLSGITGMIRNRHTLPEEAGKARKILESFGQVVEFEEEAALDAVTAVSGSGPAYVFYLIEGMTLGGVRAGLSHEDAARLALATVEGAAKLMSVQKESAESLRKKVTSPGGTTQAALEVLDGKKVRDTIADAVVAAADRSEELSR